jgi:hypothetical protein
VDGIILLFLNAGISVPAFKRTEPSVLFLSLFFLNSISNSEWLQPTAGEKPKAGGVLFSHG